MVLYRAIMVFILTLGTLPISIQLIGTNCDLSGMYFLNVVGQTDQKFGSDLMFTYGPLGFLYNTENIGHNAAIALIFYGLLTVAEIWLLWCTFRRLKGRHGILLIAISTVLFLSGVSLWSKDYYISFLVFLAISLAWTEPHPHRYLVFVTLMTAIASLIKFNTGVQCLLTLMLFVIGKLLLEKRGALRYLPYLPAVIVLYAGAFLCYNPSLRALGHYVDTNLDISSGYSTAMSLIPEPLHLLAAVVCGGCFCVFLVLVFTADFSSGVYLFLFSGALFQCFKHGYVRADAHIYIFFMGFLMIITVIAIFLDYNRLLPALKGARFRLMCCSVLTAVMVVVPLYALNPSVRDLANIFPNKLTDLRHGISARLDAKIATSDEDILPSSVLAEVGQDTVAVLPWELSIGAYNDINMVAMPALQSMMAYTAQLDAENAAFFEGANAPEYIIFSFYAIDGRVPLLETPATWRAIDENYHAVLQDGIYLVLKKSDTDYVTELGAAVEQTVDSAALVSLPQSANGMFVKVDAKLTFWGKLNKLFYQIPPVTITMNWSDGTQTTGRVLPEVLENGIVLDDLPDSLTSMCQTINGSSDGKAIVSFQIGGDGWKYYQDTMTLSFQSVLSEKEFYQYSAYQEIALTPSEDPTVGKILITPQTIWVDYLNEAPLRAETTANTMSGLQISGWALDDANKRAAQAVYLLMDGTYYEIHQTKRADVCQTYFGNADSPMCGFEGWLPLTDFVPGDYPISLVAVCEGDTYYRVDITAATVIAG